MPRVLGQQGLSCPFSNSLPSSTSRPNNSQVSNPPGMHQSSCLRQYGSRVGLQTPGSSYGRCRSRSLWTTSRLHSYSDTLPNLRIGNRTRVIFQGFTGKLVGDDLLSAGSKQLLTLVQGHSKCQRLHCLGHPYRWRRDAWPYCRAPWSSSASYGSIGLRRLLALPREPAQELISSRTGGGTAKAGCHGHLRGGPPSRGCN